MLVRVARGRGRLACAGNVDPAIANTSCSGVPQERLEFSTIFGAVDGRATAAVPVEEEAGSSGRTPVADSAGTGPYADWRPRREYEMAAKVVWRGQVYEAKWWNVGAQPDAPVEDEWDAPWRIVGPVLPTDRPVEATLVKLPDGTFPTWTSRGTYEAGDRVLHRGVAYRAKWWTQGDDPTADVDNTWQSSWEPLPASAVPPPREGAVEEPDREGSEVPVPADEVAAPAGAGLTPSPAPAPAGAATRCSGPWRADPARSGAVDGTGHRTLDHKQKRNPSCGSGDELTGPPTGVRGVGGESRAASPRCSSWGRRSPAASVGHPPRARPPAGPGSSAGRADLPSRARPREPAGFRARAAHRP